MRKIVYVLALTTVLLSACSLDKEPLDGPSSSNFPQSISEAQSGMNAAYKSLADNIGNSTPLWEVMDNMTDIGVPRRNTAAYRELTSSAATGENTCAVNFFDRMYKTIARTNLTLDGLERVEGATEEQIEALRTELLCIRAFCYNELMTHYGDVPFVDHTLSLDDNQYARSPKDSIIDVIMNDLSDTRLNYLPERHVKASYGTARIGRVAAYGLKARIALDWGKYAEAAEAARKCLDLAKEAGYALQPLDTAYCGATYEQGEPTGQTALFGFSGEQSDEWLWCVQYNRAISGNTHNGTYYHMARALGGCAYWGPTQAFIDMIQCTDGKSIVESPLYDWKHPFKNRDPRLDLYCLRPGTRIFGVQFETSKNVKKVMNYNTGVMISNLESQGTKGVYGANGNKGPGGYLWRKYLDADELNRGPVSSGGMSDLNEPVMRLAEIYLIDAEANIEMQGGNLERAREDINTIRRRVYMPEINAMTQNELRKALRYERTVELADEGFRWFDIRRWGIADKVMNGLIYAPNQNGEMSNAKPVIDDDWHVSYNENMTWDGNKFNLRTYNDMTYKVGKDELWPLPQKLLDADKLITTNNPGY